MGFWGSGLYANDTTCDIKDTYIGFLQEPLGNQEAYEKTLEKCRDYLDDEDEAPLFWYALAETQWRMGRLTPEVKTKALEWIEKDGGLALWEKSASGGAGWKKTLAKLKEKLESPIPKEKKIRKPEEVILDLWKINDVYAYQFHKNISKENGMFGKYMLLQKIGTGENTFADNPAMRVQFFDKIFDKLPTPDDMDGARILPVDFPTRVNISRDAKIYEDMDIIAEKEPIWMSALMICAKKSEYPAKHLTFVGNKQGPQNIAENRRELWWGDMERWLYEFSTLWEGFKYKTKDEGIYDYDQNSGK